MPDFDELAELLNTPPVVKRCPAARAIYDLGELGGVSAQAAMIRALENVDENTGEYVWSAPKLVRLLNDKAGFQLTPTAVQRHRGKTCSCTRPRKGQ